jgi:hypothetical protein
MARHGGTGVTRFPAPPSLTFLRRRALGTALVALASCGGDPDIEVGADSTSPASATPRTVNMDSVARVQRAESLAAATSRWNASEVVSRLEDAGLVVRDLERPVQAPGFSVPGSTLAVSGGELVIFLYPDATSRASDTGALDSATAAPPGTTATWPAAPRLINSGNLAAVLFTNREQLAERVRNVLGARHGGG